MKKKSQRDRSETNMSDAVTDQSKTLQDEKKPQKRTDEGYKTSGYDRPLYKTER